MQCSIQPTSSRPTQGSQVNLGSLARDTLAPVVLLEIAVTVERLVLEAVVHLDSLVLVYQEQADRVVSLAVAVSLANLVLAASLVLDSLDQVEQAVRLDLVG